MDKKTREQLPTTSAEEIEAYRKYMERARTQTWLTIEAPDGSLVRVTAEEAEKLEKLWHPPVYKGKTLEELIAPWTGMQDPVREMRREGLSDADIWKQAPPAWKRLIDTNWEELYANN